VIEPTDIRELVEDCRAAVERDRVDIDAGAKALDAISACPVDRPFDLWAAIDQQIGEAEAAGLRRRLMELRGRFIDVLTSAEVARLEKAFKQSPETGWRAWLTALAEAITKFRHGFATRLCEHPFPFQESQREALENLQRAVRRMYKGRWPEAYDQVDYLARQEFIPVPIRTGLLDILGQIQLFHFRKPAPAKEIFDAAEKLSRDDARILSSLGDYCVEQKDIKTARSYYERAIRIAPRASSAYVGMGASFENERNPEAAEDWYKKAIEAAPGDSIGYSKLLKLYGRPENFQKREEDLCLILDRAIAVSPEDEYQYYLDYAYICEQNRLFDKAHEWFQKAIALDETRPYGHVGVGKCCEKQGRDDDAEVAYKKAIEVAPECCDGYLALTEFYENRKRLQDALAWYERAPRIIKEWTEIIDVLLAQLHWRVGNYDEAEEIMLRELRADPHNSTAKYTLQSFADDYSEKHRDKEAAMRLYGEILKILGDRYKSSYHNRLGNLSYFYEEYEQAAREYSCAIAAAPDKPIFHRNLALVYRQLGRYTEADDELKKAFDLDRDEETFNRERSLLANAEGNAYFAKSDYRRAVESYEKAIEFAPNDAVIHSNLAGAWERIKDGGARLESLDNAIKALKRAIAIDANENYERDIKRLELKKEFAGPYGAKVIDWLHVVTPIAVEVASDLIPYIEGATEGSLSDEISNSIRNMRDRIENEFGVKIPGVRLRGNETDLPNGSYIIMINEIPLESGNITTDRRFFSGSAEDLTGLGVAAEPADNPLTDGAGFWIEQDDWKKVEGAGIEIWSVVEYLIQHLQAVLQRNLTEFFGHQEMATLLEVESPATLEEMRASPSKFTALTTVCKGLLAERAPIKPFGEIIRMFNGLYSESANLQDIVESIRYLFRSRLPGNDGRHEFIRTGAGFEADIRNSIYQSGSHSVLAMAPEACQTALSAVRSRIVGDRNNAIVVTDAALRPFVRELTAIEFPNVPVLSRRELQTDVEFETIPLIEPEENIVPETPDFRSPVWRDIRLAPEKERTVDFAEPGEVQVVAFANESLIAERSNADEESKEEMFSMMQDGLFYELGIVLPEARLWPDNALDQNEFRLELNGRKYGPVSGLKPDEFLVNDVVERLRLLNIEGRPATNPANGNKCAIVRERQGGRASIGVDSLSELCRTAGLSTWGPVGFLILALSAEIRKAAAAFQTIGVTRLILDSLRTAFPYLIDTAVKRFSTEQLCLVLRELLDEGISIRDLRGVLESLLSINGTTDVDFGRFIVFAPRAENLCLADSNRGLDDLSPADYSNFVRTTLKKYISHKYTKGGATLIVYLLDPEIERRIINTGALPLTDDEQTRLMEAISDEVGSLPPTAQTPVLLTSMEIRRTVRKLIEASFPNLAVLSYQELSPDLNIQPIARISWN
jgi:type III secretory pathway component EscV/tetratricopeptide (TPR) repeat protein